MKITIRNRLILLAAAASMTMPLSSSKADDLFQLIWRGTRYSADATGRLTPHPFTEQTVVNVLAQNNGLNPRDLVLVYRPAKYDTAVVFKSSGQVVSDYVQLPDVTLTNSNWITEIAQGSRSVRQSFLFDEYHDAPIGSLFGTQVETKTRDGSIRTVTFRGRFEFAYQDENIGFPAGVYSGTFATGRRIRDTSNP